MTRFEILDAIADIYNPSLFILYLFFSVIYFRSGDKAAFIKGLAGILIAYFLMFLDNHFAIWPAMSMDYSTHSAVAVALVIFHIHKRPSKSGGAIGFIVSLFCYFALMVYQKYRTVADIASTAIVVGLSIYLVYRLIAKITKPARPLL